MAYDWPGHKSTNSSRSSRDFPFSRSPTSPLDTVRDCGIVLGTWLSKTNNNFFPFPSPQKKKYHSSCIQINETGEKV